MQKNILIFLFFISLVVQTLATGEMTKNKLVMPQGCDLNCRTESVTNDNNFIICDIVCDTNTNDTITNLKLAMVTSVSKLYELILLNLSNVLNIMVIAFSFTVENHIATAITFILGLYCLTLILCQCCLPKHFNYYYEEEYAEDDDNNE